MDEWALVVREAGSLKSERCPPSKPHRVCDDSHETPQPVCSPRFKWSEWILVNGHSLVSRSGVSVAQRYVRGAARLMVTPEGLVSGGLTAGVLVRSRSEGALSPPNSMDTFVLL